MLDLALHTKPPTTDLQPPKHHRQPTAPHNQNPRADGINADLMGASMTHNACRIAGTVARNRHGLHGTTDLHPPKGSTIANLLQPLPQLMSRQEYRFALFTQGQTGWQMRRQPSSRIPQHGRTCAYHTPRCQQRSKNDASPLPLIDIPRHHGLRPSST